MIKFTIELEVSESWVIDGFNPSGGDIEKALSRLLPFADKGELKAKVIKAPLKKIARLQGFKTIKEMRGEQ